MMLDKDKKLLGKALVYYSIKQDEEKVDRILSWLSIDEITEVIEYMLQDNLKS